MSLSVIDKYVEKKKKDILEYAKILESLITLEDNKMWSNKSEFSVNCKEIIAIYADKYYFDNNVHRDNPIEYANDNINFVLQAIIEYIKTNNKQSMLRDLKNETFLLSVIICTSCYLDIATNVVDGNYVDTKNKFKYLLSYLKKTKILKVYNNDRVRLNELFNALKKNAKEDGKFFQYFENINCYNRYYIYTSEPVYYGMEFKYNIPELKDFDASLVDKVKENYGVKFLNISLELLVINILRELISNGEVKHYLIPLDNVLSKKISLLNPFTQKYLNKYVSILVPLEKETDYNEEIGKINKMGINIIYEYLESGNVNENKFTYDMEVIVLPEFLDNNLENEYTWDKNGIKFISRNKED